MTLATCYNIAYNACSRNDTAQAERYWTLRQGGWTTVTK